jgi:isopentenyl-diphosphate Delta-isomerase
MDKLDPTAAERKKDHIELAFKSRVAAEVLDGRFFYEPMLAAHPAPDSLPPVFFAGAALRMPVWVSSMTGGTAMARIINQNLARACGEFGMGMGLGSCRQLLYSDEYLHDFAVRPLMGPDMPLYANLGVAQIEQLLEKNETDRIPELLRKLDANGLIIHVNPLQEAMQPEGDVFKMTPLEVVKEILYHFDFSVIVKEVGQGMGPASLKALLELPLTAIEFAAGGGTNFAKLELLRSSADIQDTFMNMAAVGHSAAEMTDWVNALVAAPDATCRTQHVIISGGIRDYLDGYYLIQKSALPAVYGQASGFLKHAQGDYEALRTFILSQRRGLELATAFLKVRTNS